MTHNERINYFRRLFGNPNSRVKQETIEALNDAGYFDAYNGKLFEHCVNVANALIVFTRNMPLAWEDPESPIIVGMFHCLNQLDADNPGLGDKSLLLLSSLMRLTQEEAYCIRYYAGITSDRIQDQGDFLNAIKRYPNVLFTYAACTYTSCVYEKNEEQPHS